MGGRDDPRVFLETFQWAPRLLPLLSREAQMAALSLPRFTDICWEVPDRLGLEADWGGPSFCVGPETAQRGGTVNAGQESWKCGSLE